MRPPKSYATLRCNLATLVAASLIVSIGLVAQSALVQRQDNKQQHHDGYKPNQQQQNQNTQKRQQQQQDDVYQVGVGIADITGPSADINLMGYAKPNQDAGGIHLRQFSRAAVIEDYRGKRIAYVSLDNGMISQILRMRVLEKLKAKFGASLYTENNVMMSATHTHSAPGGFFQYLLYNIPSQGFIAQTLDSLVYGVVLSIERAHESMRKAAIYYARSELLNSSINRSPTSYKNNPAQERAMYEHNTDKTMHLLRFVDLTTNGGGDDSNKQEPFGMINWFAVHATSMNNTNHLISSDNKGYASLLFEQHFNPPATLPGKGPFVALFAQANEGDVSPNTQGPRCIDTGLPCDEATSTCNGRTEMCIASGPGSDMFESTKIIGYKQFAHALQLFEDIESQVRVRGQVRFAHQHIDMANQLVPAYKSALELAPIAARDPRRRSSSNRRVRRSSGEDVLSPSSPPSQPAMPTKHTAVANQTPQTTTNQTIATTAHFRTCLPALGYSFAAGTTDGPGAFDFTQGDTESTPMWNAVRNLLRKPSPALIDCHKPKPILLATGEMDFPYMWHPRVVPTQLFSIGQVAIVGLPGEFTTTSGRRVAAAVARTLNSNSVEQHGSEISMTSTSGNDTSGTIVILSGLSNIYTSYVATIEEYQVQRYEAASTLYGPHTLQAYIGQFVKLAEHLRRDEPMPDNKITPPDLSDSQITLKPAVLFDSAPYGKRFGDILVQVNTTHAYKCGDRVSAGFIAGNPRNDLRHEDSFLFVERFEPEQKAWTIVATDASWDTKFIWQRTNTMFGESRAILEWQIPAPNCTSGVYRLRHAGAAKSLLTQAVRQYSGQSANFAVVAGGAFDQMTVEAILTSDEPELHSKPTTVLCDAHRSSVSASDSPMSQICHNQVLATSVAAVDGDERSKERQLTGSNNIKSPLSSTLNLLRSYLNLSRWKSL